MVTGAELQRTFGQIVREQREALALTQQALADISGLHRNYIGGIERGERNPSLTQICRLASGLELPPSELFGKLEAAAER